MDKERPPYGLPGGGAPRRPEPRPQQDGEGAGDGKQADPGQQPRPPQDPRRDPAAGYGADGVTGTPNAGPPQGQPAAPPRQRDWRTVAERKSAEMKEFGGATRQPAPPHEAPAQPGGRPPAWEQGAKQPQGFDAPARGPQDFGAGRGAPERPGYGASARPGPAGAPPQGQGLPPRAGYPGRNEPGYPPQGQQQPGYGAQQPGYGAPPGGYPGQGTPPLPDPYAQAQGQQPGYGAPQGAVPPAGYPPQGAVPPQPGQEHYGDEYDYDGQQQVQPQGEYDEAHPGAYDDLYEDATQPKRRRPALLIGMLAGVAVVAGALIFAYQYSLKGGSDSGGVPVIEADKTPAKGQPKDPGGVKIPQQTKLIYERIVGEKEVRGERVVPREEPVMKVKPGQQSSNEIPAEDKTALNKVLQPEIPALGAAPDAAVGVGDAAASIPPVSGGDAPGANFAAVPDNNFSSNGMPVLPADGEQPKPPVSNNVAAVSDPGGDAAEKPPVPRAKPNLPPVTRASEGTIVPPQRSASRGGTGGSSGPLRIGPGAAPPPAAPRTNSVAPPPPSQSGPRPLLPPGGAPVTNFSPARAPAPLPQQPAARAPDGRFVVQLAAMRSQAEANARYAALRQRHGDLLGGYGPLIQRANLGDRGIYYRLRVGPIADKRTASKLCADLQARGVSDCIIHTTQ